MARSRTLVAAPFVEPPRYGLIVSARMPEDENERWVNGLTWEPETCGFVSTSPFCTDEGVVKELQDNEVIVSYYPSIFVAALKCTVQGRDIRDIQAKARRLLENTETYAIERELWTGEGHKAEFTDPADQVNDYLAHPDNTNDLNGGGALDVVDALACLEQGLAECGHGQQGMIHATVQTVSLWNERGFLRREGKTLYTILDTIVVPGSGYPGTDPDGNVGVGNVWAYGTKRVDVRRSSVQNLGGYGVEGVDRSVNDLYAYAERAAAATFDPCCHVGVRIDITPCGEAVGS